VKIASCDAAAGLPAAAGRRLNVRRAILNALGAGSGLIAAISAGYPEGRIVLGAFNAVRVALVLPKGRSAAMQVPLARRLAEAKRTGVVQNAIEQAGLTAGVRVAPD
jgi:hypothetical protein